MGPEVIVVRASINRTHVFYELLGRLYCVALRQVPIVQCSNYGKGLASKMPPPLDFSPEDDCDGSCDGGRQTDGSENEKNPCATAKSLAEQPKSLPPRGATHAWTFRTVAACTPSLRNTKNLAPSTRCCKPQHHSRALWKQ